MAVEWTESSRLWIEKRPVWLRAITEFREDWARVLEAVHSRVAAEGWLVQTYGQPKDMLQIRRPDWPPGNRAIHYELGCQEDLMQQGIVLVNLHVEDAVPNQQMVCATLRSLLRPHESKLLSGLSAFRPEFPETPVADIMRAEIRLEDVTPDTLQSVLQTMMQTETFIDESLGSAGKEELMRVDFSPGTQRPSLKWESPVTDATTGPEGGWLFSKSGGRFDGPCLRCVGGKNNYWAGQNIMVLDSPRQDICNGDEIYCCAAVHAPNGAEIRFYAEASKAGGFAVAFDGKVPVQPLDRWQLVSWQGTVSRANQCDFSKVGMHTFLIVSVPESGFKIDSVALRRIPS